MRLFGGIKSSLWSVRCWTDTRDAGADAGLKLLYGLVHIEVLSVLVEGI